MKIPIENIYYLLSYAWDRLEESELVDITGLPSTELVDLFARVLSSGVTRVLRRGLDRGYKLHEQAIPGVKGKLNITQTTKTAMFRTGKTVCAFDELSYDTPSNQIIKATIRRLLLASDLDSSNRDSLEDLRRRFGEVSDVLLNRSLFRSVQLHRNNAFNEFLLDVCRLIHDNLLADEASGTIRFQDFIRDENRMPLLFQKFVFNFLNHELTGRKVHSPRLYWHGAEGTEEDLRYLPSMQTDIVVVAPGRRIVIDTKFYLDALQKGLHRETVRSDHLYQLYAYIRNLEAISSPDIAVQGVLLYPTVAKSLDLKFRIEGHDVHVKTLNLNQSWRGIHDDLLSLVA